MAQAEEDEPDVVAAARELGHGVDDRQRVEPVPDAAGPEQHAIVLADAGHDALEHAARGARRLRRDAERHDVDQLAQRRVARVALVVDASRLQQRAEPEVALRLARADERVAGSQDDGVGEPVQHRGLGRLAVVALPRVEREVLDVQRRVEVVDAARSRAGEPPHRRHGQALRDDAVGAVRQRRRSAAGSHTSATTSSKPSGSRSVSNGTTSVTSPSSRSSRAKLR